MKNIKKIKQNDLDLVDEIMRQDLADIDLYVQQINEYFVLENKKVRKQIVAE